MQNRFGMIICFILFMIIINPALGIVPSAEESARKADEVINRRIPFTFDCDYCHVNGPAVNISMPHSNTLEYHDKLVLANETGCFICHDFYQRSKLKLLSGELIPFEDSPRLCYQCHQKKYDTWLYGDHGKSIIELDVVTQNKTEEELKGRRIRCSDFQCHNPHNPKLFKVPLGADYPLPSSLNPPEPARIFGNSNGEPYYEAVLFTGKIFFGAVVLVLLISSVMIFLHKRKKGGD